MKVVIYIEDGVNEMDFVLPYELFITGRETEVYIVSKKGGLLTTQSGVQIALKYNINDIEQADILWVCGRYTISSCDDVVSSWLFKIASTARYVVGLCTGTVHLIHANILQNIQVSLPKVYVKQFKKHSISYIQKPIVIDGKFITGATNAEAFSIILMICLELYSQDHIAYLSERYQFEFDLPAFDLDTKFWSKVETGYKKYMDKYLKTLAKGVDKYKQICIHYAFEDMRAIDFFCGLNIIAHLPFKGVIVANQKGFITVEGNGFKVMATEAIQNYTTSHLMIIPGGIGLRKQLVNTYLIHWLTSICPRSFRVLTIEEGEQLLGVCGILKDVDPTVLSELSLGEGKYMMVNSFVSAMQSLINIANKEYKGIGTDINRYSGFGETCKISIK